MISMSSRFGLAIGELSLFAASLPQDVTSPPILRAIEGGWQSGVWGALHGSPKE